jgi:hypothetical protein
VALNVEHFDLSITISETSVVTSFINLIMGNTIPYSFKEIKPKVLTF